MLEPVGRVLEPRDDPAPTTTALLGTTTELAQTAAAAVAPSDAPDPDAELIQRVLQTVDSLPRDTAALDAVAEPVEAATQVADRPVGRLVQRLEPAPRDVSQPAAHVLQPATRSAGTLLDPIEQPLVDVLLPIAVPVVETLAPLAQPVGQLLEPLAQPVADVLEPVVAPAGQLLEPVGEVLSPVAQPVGQLLDPVLVPVAQALLPVTQPVVQVLEPVVQPLAQGLSPVTQAIEPIVGPVVDPLGAVLQPVTEPLSPVLQPVIGPISSPSHPSVGPANQTPQTPQTALQTPDATVQPSLPATRDGQATTQAEASNPQPAQSPSASVPPAATAGSSTPGVVPSVSFSAQPADDPLHGALSSSNRVVDTPASALDRHPPLPGVGLDPAQVPAPSGRTQTPSGGKPTVLVPGATLLPSEASTSRIATSSADPMLPAPDVQLTAALGSPPSVAKAAAPDDPMRPRPTPANLASGEISPTSASLTLPNHWPSNSGQARSNSHQPFNPNPAESGSPPASSSPVPPVSFNNGMGSSSGSLAGGGSSSAAAALTSLSDPLAITRSALNRADALLPASHIPETVTPPR